MEPFSRGPANIDPNLSSALNAWEAEHHKPLTIKDLKETSWGGKYYISKAEDSGIVKIVHLNWAERFFRALFGAYSDTIFTGGRSKTLKSYIRQIKQIAKNSPLIPMTGLVRDAATFAFVGGAAAGAAGGPFQWDTKGAAAGAVGGYAKGPEGDEKDVRAGAVVAGEPRKIKDAEIALLKDHISVLSEYLRKVSEFRKPGFEELEPQIQGYRRALLDAINASYEKLKLLLEPDPQVAAEIARMKTALAIGDHYSQTVDILQKQIKILEGKLAAASTPEGALTELRAERDGLQRQLAQLRSEGEQRLETEFDFKKAQETREAELERLRGQLSAYRKQAEAMAHFEGREEGLEREITRLQAALDAKKGELSPLQLELMRLRQELERAEERRGAAEGSVGTTRAAGVVRLSELQQKLDEATRARDELQAQISDLRAAREREISGLRQQLEGARIKGERPFDTIHKLEDQISTLKRRVEEADSSLKEQLRRNASLRRREDAREADLTQLRGRGDAAAAELNRLRGLADESVVAARTSDAEVARLRREVVSDRTLLDAAQVQLSQMKAQLDRERADAAARVSDAGAAAEALRREKEQTVAAARASGDEAVRLREELEGDRARWQAAVGATASLEAELNDARVELSRMEERLAGERAQAEARVSDAGAAAQAELKTLRDAFAQLKQERIEERRQVNDMQTELRTLRERVAQRGAAADLKEREAAVAPAAAPAPRAAPAAAKVAPWAPQEIKKKIVESFEPKKGVSLEIFIKEAEARVRDGKAVQGKFNELHQLMGAQKEFEKKRTEAESDRKTHKATYAKALVAPKEDVQYARDRAKFEKDIANARATLTGALQQYYGTAWHKVDSDAKLKKEFEGLNSEVGKLEEDLAKARAKKALRDKDPGADDLVNKIKLPK